MRTTKAFTLFSTSNGTVRSAAKYSDVHEHGRSPRAVTTTTTTTRLACSLAAVLSLCACGSSNGSPVTPSSDAGDAAVDAGPDLTGDPPSCTGAPGTGGNPPARGDFAGALDTSASHLVVFGGDTAVPICGGFPPRKHVGDTWVLDVGCGSWHPTATTAAPPARARHAMASDGARGRALLFGGRTRAGTSGPYTLFDDVWAFDFASEAWTPVTTTGTAPSPRCSAAAVVDSKAGELIVYGGSTDTTGMAFVPQSDTFALDLASGQWRAIAANPSPPARLFHAMAIDEGARAVYLFSGGDANAFTGPFLTDVWKLDLATETWSQLTTGGTPPNGRINHGVAFDTVSQRLVTFGGHDDGQVGNENDLYALDVTASPAIWSKLPGGDVFNKPSTAQCAFPPDFTTLDKGAPERREAFAFGARADGRAFVVFAGKSDCGLLDDVWWWADGRQQWSPIVTSPVGQSCLRTQTTCTGLCG